MNNIDNSNLIASEFNNISIILTYQEYINKIILTFPIYYNIFQKYYSSGKNVSDELNRIYQPIFIGLMEFYSEFMTKGIIEIINLIQNKYNPESNYAIIDYIEYLFGNILYETFLIEIKKININSIRYEYLCVFEYIIRVELIKFDLYQKILNKLEPESKIFYAFEHRISNCLKKISFSLGYLKKKFSTHENIFQLCRKLIEEFKFNIKDKIDINIVDKIDSFIKINNSS